MSAILFTDYLDSINANLEIIYFHNKETQWMAKITNSYIISKSNDNLIPKIYGIGISPDEDIEDYIKKLEGKILIITRTSGSEEYEFVFPSNIYYQVPPF